MKSILLRGGLSWGEVAVLPPLLSLSRYHVFGTVTFATDDDVFMRLEDFSVRLCYR